MARVLCGKTLAFEYVPQVAVAVCAADLHPSAIRICKPPHGTRNLLVETRPPASGMEFRVGSIQLGIAAPANVGAGTIFIFVFAAEWRLGTPAHENLFLFWRQRIQLHGSILTVRCPIRNHLPGELARNPAAYVEFGCTMYPCEYFLHLRCYLLLACLLCSSRRVPRRGMMRHCVERFHPCSTT